MGQAVAEHWRLSAHRLVEDLTVSPLARQGHVLESRLLGLLRGAGQEGLKLRDMYRTLRLDAATARQTALELVRPASWSKPALELPKPMLWQENQHEPGDTLRHFCDTFSAGFSSN